MHAAQDGRIKAVDRGLLEFEHGHEQDSLNRGGIEFESRAWRAFLMGLLGAVVLVFRQTGLSSTPQRMNKANSAGAMPMKNNRRQE